MFESFCTTPPPLEPANPHNGPWSAHADHGGGTMTHLMANGKIRGPVVVQPGPEHQAGPLFYNSITEAQAGI